MYNEKKSIYGADALGAAMLLDVLNGLQARLDCFLESEERKEISIPFAVVRAGYNLSRNHQKISAVEGFLMSGRSLYVNEDSCGDPVAADVSASIVLNELKNPLRLLINGRDFKLERVDPAWKGAYRRAVRSGSFTLELEAYSYDENIITLAVIFQYKKMRPSVMDSKPPLPGLPRKVSGHSNVEELYREPSVFIAVLWKAAR